MPSPIAEKITFRAKLNFYKIYTGSNPRTKFSQNSPFSAESVTSALVGLVETSGDRVVAVVRSRGDVTLSDFGVVFIDEIELSFFGVSTLGGVWL